MIHVDPLKTRICCCGVGVVVLCLFRRTGVVGQAVLNLLHPGRNLHGGFCNTVLLLCFVLETSWGAAPSHTIIRMLSGIGKQKMHEKLFIRYN